MATQNKFYVFTKDISEAKHDFASHVFKVMLTNTAPVATNTIKANLTEITAANGYPAGGSASTITKNNALGVETISGAQVVFTASGGSIGPFRYAVLYNDTQTSPADPLVAWIDYSSALTLLDTESLTVKFNNANPGTIHTLT